MTPPTKEFLYHVGYFKTREFDYQKRTWYAPYEDLMIENQPMHQHLPTLNFIVKEFNLKDILELGTQTGFSTVALGYAVKDIGGHLTSVDIVNCPLAREKMEKRKLSKNWTFFEGQDDLTLNWNKKIDCLFIDSKHTYEQLKAELKKYVPFVKKNGFVILHDVIVYSEEFYDLPYSTGKINYKRQMAKAIDEYFKDKNTRYYRWFNDCGLGVMRKLY